MLLLIKPLKPITSIVQLVQHQILGSTPDLCYKVALSKLSISILVRKLNFKFYHCMTISSISCKCCATPIQVINVDLVYIYILYTMAWSLSMKYYTFRRTLPHNIFDLVLVALLCLKGCLSGVGHDSSVSMKQLWRILVNRPLWLSKKDINKKHKRPRHILLCTPY